MADDVFLQIKTIPEKRQPIDISVNLRIPVRIVKEHINTGFFQKLILLSDLLFDPRIDIVFRVFNIAHGGKIYAFHLRT